MNKKLNEDLAQIKNEKNAQQITLDNLNIKLSNAQNQLNNITKERDDLKKREEELILKLTKATKNCESFAQKISNLGNNINNKKMNWTKKIKIQ